jgi:hypothetical protein
MLPSGTADAGANQLVLVMARLKSESVLPDRPPKGLLASRPGVSVARGLRHRIDTVALPTHPRQVLSFANVFGFRWPQPTSSSPSGGGGPPCEAKGAD